jgi:hypothetical protein
MWIDLWWYLIGFHLTVQSLNINIFSCCFVCVCVFTCIFIKLYVSNHCIKLFAPCGTLIGNKKFLLSLPNKVWETYCFCSVSYYYYYYYYVTPNAVGWRIAILRFFFTIITIILIIIILPHIFVRSISRRCLDQTLWNLVGISYAMWSCAV